MMEDHLNVIRREAERVDVRSTSWAVGVIDSYDKATHSAKVKLQPEGVVSGLLPLNSLAIGKSFGIHVAPKVGDPVLVHFHEGDREAGLIMGRFFTDAHQPVGIEEGEYLLKHEKGQQVFFKKDGTFLIIGKDGSNAQIEIDPDGTILLTRGEGQIKMDPSGNIGIKPDGATLYLGALSGGGNFARVMTEAGPSKNVKALI